MLMLVAAQSLNYPMTNHQRVNAENITSASTGDLHRPLADWDQDQRGEEATSVPKTTIYMQAIDFLLEVKALPVSSGP